jgi:hypothetical protein
MVEKCSYDKNLMNVLGKEKMKTREDTILFKVGFSSFFSKLPFWGINLYKKIAYNLLFGAWLLLSVHIRFTPSEGPKGFVN